MSDDALAFIKHGFGEVLKNQDSLKQDMFQKQDVLMEHLKRMEASAQYTTEDLYDMQENFIDDLERVETAVKNVKATVNAQEERLGAVEEKLEALEVDKLLQLNKQLQDQLASQEQRLRALESSGSTQHLLAEQVAVTSHQTAILQQTQHSEYFRAFSKNLDFKEVFMFMVCFGFSTVKGEVCAVIEKIRGVQCICVNFRALMCIAKQWLSSRRVATSKTFPAFSLFKLGNLQQLFREANLPFCSLDKKLIDDVLVPRVAIKKYDSKAATLLNWVALEMRPFVRAVKTLLESGELKKFMQPFETQYPKNVKVKFTDYDRCILPGTPEAAKWSGPLFHVPYWQDLFYDNLKVWNQSMFGDETLSHLTSFYQKSDEAIAESLKDLLTPSSSSEEEDDEEEEVGSKRAAPVVDRGNGSIKHPRYR